MKNFKMVVVIAAVLTFTLSGMAMAKQLELGLAWVGKSGMANRVSKGLEAALKELVPDAKIEAQKELASTEDLSKVVGKWEKEKDGMIILRSNGAKWLGKNSPEVPTFIGGCNHPVQLGAVKNLKSPEGNITGVTYYLPVDTQFEIFQAILPEIKSVLLLVEKGHPSSLIDKAGTEKICKKLGIEYQEKFVSSEAEAAQVATENKGKVSAIIIGNQAMIMEVADKIVEAAGDTPVVSYSNKAVKLGALGGFVADDNKLGQMLAESVVDVLGKGKAVKDVPVKVDPDPKFYVNAKTAEKLGVEIPFSILESATVIE